MQFVFSYLKDKWFHSASRIESQMVRRILCIICKTKWNSSFEKVLVLQNINTFLHLQEEKKCLGFTLSSNWAFFFFFLMQMVLLFHILHPRSASNLRKHGHGTTLFSVRRCCHLYSRGQRSCSSRGEKT